MPILKQEKALYPGDLFESPAKGPWWVPYVKSRREKMLARWLREHDIPHYLPLRRHLTRRAGRRLISYLPLFPGYLFFRGDLGDRVCALRSNLIIQVLPVDDSAALERELSGLWRLQQATEAIRPCPYLPPGEMVRLTDGPFAGLVGQVVRGKGLLRVIVSIELLRRSVIAELDREAVVPLSPSPMRPAVAHAAWR